MPETTPPKKITEMWAYVMAEEDGGDGVPAFSNRGMMFPLMGSDLSRAESLLPIAQSFADTFGRPLRILKFTHMEQVGFVIPQGGGAKVKVSGQ